MTTGLPYADALTQALNHRATRGRRADIIVLRDRPSPRMAARRSHRADARGGARQMPCVVAPRAANLRLVYAVADVGFHQVALRERLRRLARRAERPVGGLFTSLGKPAGAARRRRRR